MPNLVNRVGPTGYVPSGEPRGGMLPEGEGWLEGMILQLLGPQRPPQAPMARPAALRGINGMLRPAPAPYREQYPYPQLPPRG